MNLFAKNIQVLRTKMHLTQADMKVQLGFNRTTWNNYERGVSQPDLEGFFKIAKFFGIPVEDLFFSDLENRDFSSNAGDKKENEKVPVKSKNKEYEDLETYSFAADEGPGKERPKIFISWSDHTKEINALKNLIAKHNDRLTKLEQKAKELSSIIKNQT